MCPGSKNYPSESVRFKTKNVRMWGCPFERIDSVSCALFHAPKNCKLHPLHHLYDVCSSCKLLANAIEQLEQRACDVSPTT